MKRHMGRSAVAALLVAALLVGMAPVMAAGAGADRSAPQWTRGRLDPEETITVLVELEAAPAAEVATYSARGAAEYKAALMDAQAEVMENAQASLELEMGYQYDTLFNGFSCDIAYGDAAALSRMEGVKAVYPVQHYDAPEAVEREPATMLPQMMDCGGVTGNDQMNTEGHGGQGMVVAVLDSGLNLDHTAFGVYPEMLGEAALTQEAVEAKIAAAEADNGTGGRGKYVSAKIPFACNYADLANSTNITHGNAHGTHVAGIVGGYEEGEDKVVFAGAAPGAQILGMQIFGDTGGTSTDIYLKALEDALNLGADVVNMSLGSPNGFSTIGDTESPEEAIYRRLTEAGVVVCISAGNSGPYFQNQDSRYTDYATVGSPSTLGSNISVASVDNVGKDAAKDGICRVSSFSSRGPAPTLDIRPTLTSVGGNVVSADATTNNGYVAQWGTSMSAPNLAGTFATLLDYLRTVKNLDKAAAGQLARVLMESCATPVAGMNDCYASVMQQGAGLGNSAKAMAAYEHGAYLENPIQELRDDPGKTGVYTMDLTLKNATGADVTYVPGAVVMTDEVVDGKDTQNSIFLYKNGETLGFEGEMAAVTCAPETVTVPAGGTADVSVTVTLTEAGKTYMNETFPSGGYINGFVTFTPQTAETGAPEIHATYLAYYGDWAAAPALTGVPPVSGEQELPTGEPGGAMLGFCDFNADGRPFRDDYLALGENPMNGWNATESEPGDTAPYKVQHAAFPGGYKTSTGKDNILYNTLVVETAALRNMQSLTFQATDESETAAYRTTTTPWRLTKTSYNQETKQWSKAWRFEWDAWNGVKTEDNVTGTPWLASDKTAKVTLTAAMPYDRGKDGSWESQTCARFTVVVDHEDPALDEGKAVYDRENGTLTLQAVDNQYVAAVYLVDGEGQTLDCDLFSEDAPNTAVTAALDVSGHALGDTVKVRVMDYATNWIEKEITLAEPPAPPEPGQVAVTFDLNGGTYPEAHEDYLQTVTEGEAPAKPAADPTRTDYVFLGWAAAPDGAVLDTFPPAADADVTYYARWEAAEPTVSVALSYDEATKTITATPTVNLAEYHITYAWTENGETAPGATQGSAYTVPQDAQPGEHVYTCVATVTHPGDETKTAASEPASYTVTVAQSVDPDPDPDPDPGNNPGGGTGGGTGGGSGSGGTGGGGGSIGGGGGGGAAPAGTDATEKRENEDGLAVTVVTTSTGDKTFTVTDADGGQAAQVDIPAQIEPVGADGRFTDVPEGHWSDEAIHRMASLGLLKGVDPEHRIFDMTAPMTRGALAEVLYRLSHGAAGIQQSFTDVEPDAWYAQGVAWAAKYGVVSGTGTGTFQPQRVITRQELATMMYRYARFLGAADEAPTERLNTFTDGGDTADWALTGVAWCVQAGIIQGKGNGVLDPTAPISRAEAATMLDRLLRTLK